MTLISRRVRCLIAPLVALALALLPALHAFADPGTLDPSFGTGGVATLHAPSPSGSLQTVWQDIRELPDGRILVSGSCGTFPNVRLCLARLLPNGAIDPSFGVAGFATALPSASGITWSDGGGMTIERNGRITVAGSCGGSGDFRLCYARFDTAGNLVDSGQWVFSVGPSYGVTVLALRNGQRVLMAECGFAICLLQLNPDGTPATWFGTGGAVVLHSGTDHFKPTAIIESSGSALYLAATCGSPSGGFRACVVSLDYTGGLATWFGSGGRALMPHSDLSTGDALAMAPDGSLLLAGACRVSPTERRVCLSRLDEMGVFQPTLGPGVIVHPITSGDHYNTRVALQADGRATLVAQCRDSGASEYDLCALRLKQNGAPDATFGITRSGKNRFDFSSLGSEWAGGITLRRNGALLVTALWSGTGRVFQLRGGPEGAPRCSLDLDGDGVVAGETDVQVFTRVLMGITGDAVPRGLVFAPHAMRTTWPALRTFLTRQCGLRLP